MERRLDTHSEFEIVGSVGPDVTDFDDNTAVKDELQHYRVAAFDDDGLSDYSNEASITPGGSGTGSGSGPMTDKTITGYFPSWGIYNARKYWVRYIPFDRAIAISSPTTSTSDTKARPTPISRSSSRWAAGPGPKTFPMPR